MSAGPATIRTLGHSTRPLDDFLALLRENRIDVLADVRAFPGSRRHPHFGKDALDTSLERLGIRYVHLPELGGRRRGLGERSPNAGWRNTALRAYADHMDSEDFRRALAQLEAIAEGRRVAVMCSEAVPWRCHRWLLSDALVVRGHPVEHVLGPGQVRAHSLTPFARVEETRITYPAGAAAQGSLFG